jgi:hypothetical protein
VLLSSLFSTSVAEGLLLHSAFPTVFGKWLLWMVGTALYVVLLQRLSGFLSRQDQNLAPWFCGATRALVPLHLLLPAAWIARAMGSAGWLGFSLFELLAVGWIMRRAIWEVNGLTSWPLWAAALFILAPFIIAAVIAAAFCALILTILTVGLLGVLYA